MPKEDFKVDRKEYEEGYAVHVLYKDQGVARMEHRKRLDSKFILNYNVMVPSTKSIVDNVRPVMSLLTKLDEKKVREVIQALKDAGEDSQWYEDATVFPNAFGYVRNTDHATTIPFYTKEIERAVKEGRFNFVGLKNKFGSGFIEVCGNRNFSYHKINVQPITEVRFDGFAWDVADELKELCVAVGHTQVPEEEQFHLVKSLEEMLSHFRETNL